MILSFVSKLLMVLDLILDFIWLSIVCWVDFRRNELYIWLEYIIRFIERREIFRRLIK